MLFVKTIDCLKASFHSIVWNLFQEQRLIQMYWKLVFWAEILVGIVNFLTTLYWTLFLLLEHHERSLGKWPIWWTITLYNTFYYYNPLHVSSNSVLIIRKSNCINTASGVVFSKWPTGVQFENLPTERSHTDNTIQVVVLIQFDLLMMSTELLETCRGL